MKRLKKGDTTTLIVRHSKSGHITKNREVVRRVFRGMVWLVRGENDDELGPFDENTGIYLGTQVPGYTTKISSLRTLTKKPMLLSTVRIPVRDAEIWLNAAALEGTSRSEFLRMAILERAQRILKT